MFTYPLRSPAARSTRDEDDNTSVGSIQTPGSGLSFTPYYPKKFTPQCKVRVNVGGGTLGRGHFTEQNELTRTVSLHVTKDESVVNCGVPLSSTPRCEDTDLKRCMSSPDVSIFSDVSQICDTPKNNRTYGYRQLRTRQVRLGDYIPAKRKKKKEVGVENP